MANIQQPSVAACPHCGAANRMGDQFCADCGKALPAASAAGPRVVDSDSVPTSAAGQMLVADELNKHVRRAANTLLAVGLIQLTCGAIVVVLLTQAARTMPEIVMILLAAQFVVASVFIGLYFWARKAPLPATIVGLVVYATLVAANVMAAMQRIGSGGPSQGIGGIGIGWLDILLIALMAQGIQAALKHRRLLEASAAQ